MSDRYDINEGECYRHIWTHVLVRVTKVRWHEGITGLVHWETLNESKIDGVTSGIRRRSTPWKTSTLYTFAPLSLRKAGLAGVSSSALDPCDALLPNAGKGVRQYGVTIAINPISVRNMAGAGGTDERN